MNICDHLEWLLGDFLSLLTTLPVPRLGLEMLFGTKIKLLFTCNNISFQKTKRYFLFEGGFIFRQSCLILFTVFKHQFGTEVLMKQGKRTNKRREPTNERKQTNNKIVKLLGRQHRNPGIHYCYNNQIVPHQKENSCFMISNTANEVVESRKAEIFLEL